MILLDTNVIIDAHYGVGDHRVRARNLISSAVIDTAQRLKTKVAHRTAPRPACGERTEVRGDWFVLFRKLR